ncbi:unknown [Streptomyces phage mu1/6]|uniref:hypothetical protein n=1 Tax=Streptomyces phage mu1/6 TaxID=370623 RepID=UPI0000D4F6CA|nr:hypothetical protein SPMV1_gp28 [Streptomyces phage mu1/6]ABD94193.1 unknown [Streptomyces phage mu1/6]
MTHRTPTHMPLTPTERERLDYLVRRAARHLGVGEEALLLRLWDHDQADRAQERRSAGGLRAALDRLNHRTPDDAR